VRTEDGAGDDLAHKRDAPETDRELRRHLRRDEDDRDLEQKPVGVGQRQISAPRSSKRDRGGP
jgi:hypothetical protein